MITLIEVFWKSGAALGTALLINLLLRRRSADVRRLVLSTLIIAMFLAVLALPILPRWTAVEPDWLSTVEAPPIVPGADPMPIKSAVHTPTIQVTTAPAPHPGASIRTRIPGAIPLLWCFGSALLLVRFAFGLYGLRRIRNVSKPVTDPAVLDSLSDISARDVALLQNDTIAAPVTWGIFRPIILVPTGFGELPPECRRAVLCHELAHIRNSDFFLRSLSEIARAMLWFQPLMWIAARQLREEQELACDNRVLADGGKPSAYAKLLLDWDLRPGLDSLIAVGIAHRSCLKRRLYALLDQNQRRERVTATVVLAMGLLGLATAFPLAAIDFTRAATPQPKVPLTFHPAPPVPQPAIPSPRSRTQLAQARPAPATPPASPAVPAVRMVPAALFVSTSTMVVSGVTVTGQDGRSVEGLSVDDFLITEDDKPMRTMLAEYQKVNDTQAQSYYVVAYYSTNARPDITYRTIKVALKNRDASLNYRPGYYYGSPSTPPGTYLPVEMPSDVRPPTLLIKVEPEYSEEARKAKYSGTVSLFVDVDASGKATNVRVIRPLGLGLDEKAVAAVMRWRFNPAKKDGEPVGAPVRVELSFRLL